MTNATTLYGKGLLPPLVRNIVHLQMLAIAVKNGYPINNGWVHDEVENAIAHNLGMTIPNDLLTTKSTTAMDGYKKALDLLATKTRAAADNDPDGIPDDLRAPILDTVKQTYALLSYLDEELCGYQPNETDPGELA